MYVRRNILSYHNKKYLRSCNYNAESDRLCPIFRVGDVVSAANNNSGNHGDTYEEIAVKVGHMLPVLHYRLQVLFIVSGR